MIFAWQSLIITTQRHLVDPIGRFLSISCVAACVPSQATTS